MYTLELRQAVPRGQCAFKPYKKYSRYRKAVLEGQRLAGPSNFLVSSKNVPTREEQLLIETESDILDTI